MATDAIVARRGKTITATKDHLPDSPSNPGRSFCVSSADRNRSCRRREHQRHRHRTCLKIDCEKNRSSRTTLSSGRGHREPVSTRCGLMKKGLAFVKRVALSDALESVPNRDVGIRGFVYGKVTFEHAAMDSEFL